MRGNVVKNTLPFARIRAPHGERHHFRARIFHGGADEFERILARAEDEARAEHFAAKLQHIFLLLLFHTISPFALPLGEAFPPSTAHPRRSTMRFIASAAADETHDLHDVARRKPHRFIRRPRHDLAVSLDGDACGHITGLSQIVQEHPAVCRNVLAVDLHHLHPSQKENRTRQSGVCGQNRPLFPTLA